MIDVTTEQDPERLRTIADVALRENALLRRRITTLVGRLAKAEGVEQAELLAAEIAELTGQLNRALDDHSIDGRSERRRDDEKEDRDSNRSTNSDAQTGHGPTAQPDLEVEQEVLELDEADKICPECGGVLGEIEGQYEESELIDVVDVTYKLRKVKRQKYRCDNSCCQHIDTALGTDDRLVDGGRYSVDFGVSVVEGKYLLHLPLHRQAKHMRLNGLRITPQTLCDQVLRIAEMLEPSWHALYALQMDQDVLGADESRWRLMDGTKAKPQIIGTASEQAIWYGFEMNKTAETVDAILADFEGWLIVDGLSVYPAVHQRRHDGYINGTRDGPPFRMANCWVHARRYYIKAEPDFPQADEMLELIAKLYRVVGGAERHGIRGPVRKQWVQCLLDAMKAWMLEARPAAGSSLERAIKYMQNHWRGLTRFVDHPEVWLDNNATERALRAPILGRKNHYGSKSERGMKAAAILYSLIETCQLVGVNPRDYLREAVYRAKANPDDAYLPHAMLGDASDLN
jgi:transposase